MRYQRVWDSAPERDQALIAHLGEVLGQGRLREINRLRERAYVSLAPLHQFAQDHQPPLVAEGTENVGHLGGPAPQRGCVKLARPEHLNLFF